MSRRDDDRVTIKGLVVVHETEKAICVTDNSGEDFWLPKSQIEVYKSGIVSLPKWLAKERGFDYK